MERGLREQVVELQHQAAQASADLMDTRQAHSVTHRVLHGELAESERSLGGAALFWAACYDQAFPLTGALGLDDGRARLDTRAARCSHGERSNGSFASTGSRQRPHILSASLYSSDSGEEW